MPDLSPITRALISVSDKDGLVPFCTALARAGVELVSTGGTAKALRDAGLKVTLVESLTGFPEIMDGRVKTLHPKVHGGLLARRDDPAHLQQMAQHAIVPIDLVCVNLYPFERAVARPDCTRELAIENIDIGGPSMIRSAAKNHAHVCVVTSPSQYQRVIAELQEHRGATTRRLRDDLAAEAFAMTARYDAAIASYLAPGGDNPFPPLLTINLVKGEDLRHGENPHQRAALYRVRSQAQALAAPSIASAEQLHGKELSYNNLNDGAAALELALSLGAIAPGLAGACVVKHTNPCGAAIATEPALAVQLAIAGDPVAAYGGILALNRVVDGRAAESIARKDHFFEVVVAPSFDADALALLRSRWVNVRLLAVGEPSMARRDEHPHPRDHELRSIPGGVLVQERDHRWTPHSAMIHAAGPAPTREQQEAAAFLEVVGKFLFSNAIVLGGPSPEAPGALRMFGAGAGQMDRLTSCRIAIEKSGRLARGAIAYSDAFFPFPDGPEALANAGVACIVHPGGSKRDQETFDLCNARGVTCLTTGTRHFRH